VTNWANVKNEFTQNRSGMLDFAAMVTGTRPRQVVEALADRAAALDAGGYAHWFEHDGRLRDEALVKAAEYLDADEGEVTFTHSTSMGLAQVLGGVPIKAGQEILISANEHQVATETLMLRARRDQTPFRRVQLFRSSLTLSASEIVQNLAAEIRPWTRILTLAWVYSSDGVKLPIAKIARLVADHNRTRSEDDRLLFVVDGVHGLGIEADGFKSLACDFLVAGCHKLLYGPRGTAVICGKAASWKHVVPWVAKLGGSSRIPGSDHVPGGVKIYENIYALQEAFDFHLDVGKPAIADRLHHLASELKKQLTAINGVTVRTPASPDLSSAMVSFDVARWTADQVKTALLDARHKVMASTSAWDYHEGRNHVRLSISLALDENDIATAVGEIAHIAGRTPP
jgi:selenocysteine lyase/cysteine desulfurase